MPIAQKLRHLQPSYRYKDKDQEKDNYKGKDEDKDSAMHANWPKAKTSATPDTRTKTDHEKDNFQEKNKDKDSAMHANWPKAKTSATPDTKTKTKTNIKTKTKTNLTLHKSPTWHQANRSPKRESNDWWGPPTYKQEMGKIWKSSRYDRYIICAF